MSSEPTAEDLLGQRRIALRGPVDHISSARVCLSLMYLDAQDAQDAGRRIGVTVDSAGGAIDDGMAVCDTIERSRSPVDTHAVGHVAGVAVLIVASGTPGRRSADPACGWQLAWTDARHPGVAADQLKAAADEASAAFAEQLARRSQRPAEHWLADMKRHAAFSSDEALAWGLVDRVGDAAEEG